MAISKIIINGRLGSDPELKTTKDGKKVCNFSVAVDTGYGERKVTDWFDFVAWEQRAEFICNYARKGSNLNIEGTPHVRKYTTSNGTSAQRFEIALQDVQLLDKRETGEAPKGDLPF